MPQATFRSLFLKIDDERLINKVKNILNEIDTPEIYCI